MADSSAGLGIRVHLASGSTSTFVQPDLAEGRRIAARIDPEKLFSQKFISIAGERSMTNFPASAVERVDLLMQNPPEWPLPDGVQDVVELYPEHFRNMLAERSGHNNSSESHQPARAQTVLAQLELTSGRISYALVRLETGAEPAGLTGQLEQILTAPALWARGAQGGTVIINPAHLVRFSMHPAPAQPPEHAWHAEETAG